LRSFSAQEDRMNIHKNARLTPHSRAELVRRVLALRRSPMSVATDMGVSVRTVHKWVARYRAEGEGGLADRSSRPHRLRRPTPAATIERIEALRRQRWTGKRIAITVGLSSATVSRVLRRLGISRLKALEPAEPVRRYQREHPGELIHIDIKKLGRFERIGHRITGDRAHRSDRHGRSKKAGWEFVHVCIDDASRIAFSQILPDERKQSAVAFLTAAIAYYAGLGVSVTRVMTDNGSCYRSRAFRAACKALGLKHIRTSPTRPRPTARPSASSRPASGNGPTPRPTQPPNTAPPSCPPGSINITGTARTAAYTTNHPSADWAWT
jgi:transposase